MDTKRITHFNGLFLNAPLAQLVEHPVYTRAIASRLEDDLGSSPRGSTKFAGVVEWQTLQS